MHPKLKDEVVKKLRGKFMNKNTSPVFDKNLISDFKSKFIKYDEREKYLLLCEMVKKVEPKQTETFYRPMLNRFTVIMNEILDQIEKKH